GLPEGTACAQEAETELIVLIADQLLVEQAEAFQHRSPPTAEIDGINGTFVFDPMESGPADREPTIEGGGNAALQIGASAGQPGAANLVGPGFHQGGHALAQVVRGVLRMGIDADDDFPARRPDGRIEPA